MPTWESDLWEIDLASGKERRLTEDSFIDSYPAYSPDGQWLAFLSERSGSRQVWLLPRSSGEALPLTRDAEDVYLGTLTWLPDSRGVMYTRAGKIRIAWLDSAEESTIEFTADLAVTRWHGTRRTEIPGPSERRRARGIFTPALSPDGKRIAFAALGDLWIADVAGGKPARLTRTEADESYPRWSPDGRWLAYLCAAPEVGSEVRVLELEKPDMPRTILTARTTEFAWSPDGRRLAYAEADKVGWVDLASSAKHEIAKEQSMARLLGWSAKDDSILFATSALGPPPSYLMMSQVWRIRSDGGIPQEMKWPEDSLVHAALSPDLSRVAYSVSGAGYYARIPESGAPTRIPDPSPRFLSWSADGRSMLYLSGADVRLLDVERGVARTLRILPEYRTPPAPQPLLFRNAHIIDGTGAAPSAASDILVSGSRIRRIASAGKIARRAGAREIDAAGRYLLPGLFNVHIHRNPYSPFAAALLYNGVLAIRDVGKDAEWMQSQREGVEAGELLAPRMFMTGGVVVTEWGASWSNQRAVDPRDPKSVSDAAAAMSAAGADWIKPFFRDPLLDARVIEAGHAQGLPVTSHFIFLSSLARGLNGKEHADLYYRGYTEIFRQDVLAALRTGDILVTPTLVTWSAMMAGLSPVVPLEDRLLEDPALTVLYRSSVLKKAREDMRQSIPERRLEQLKKAQRWELESVKRLRDAGIRIATGTDIGPPWNEMGVHLEMELLVKAGLTPLEAIRAATLEGARCLGVERDLGTVETGKLADFILVNGDPSQDIRRTREIELIVLGGEPYTRQQILDRVRR
jgi:Tol biopolymer transport system component